MKYTNAKLEHGYANKILAVDVGTNQLDWKLRRDPCVVAMEKTNARYLTFEQIGERVALATMDVSFISANLILPVLPPLMEPRAEILVLVKPQFEVGRGLANQVALLRVLLRIGPDVQREHDAEHHDDHRERSPPPAAGQAAWGKAHRSPHHERHEEDGESGSPAMLSRVTAFVHNNTPIEYSVAITRGDKCRFYFHFRE